MVAGDFEWECHFVESIDRTWCGFAGLQSLRAKNRKTVPDCIRLGFLLNWQQRMSCSPWWRHTDEKGLGD